MINVQGSKLVAGTSIASLLFAALLHTSIGLAAPADCTDLFNKAPDAMLAIMERVSEANDPMPKEGAYAGQLVENSKSRTLKFLTPEEKDLMGLARNQLAVANYRDHGHFYIATIDGIEIDAQNNPIGSSAAVKEIRLLQEHWDALTDPALAELKSHTYLQFIFAEGRGARLIYDQSTMSAVDPKTPPVNSVVMSIEAIRPQSEPDANFIPHAFVFDFAIGHLVYSAHDRFQSEQADTGRVVENDGLNFANATSRFAGISTAKEAVLFRAIQASNQYGRSLTYNVAITNCTNGTFNVLDSALIFKTGFDQSVFKAELLKVAEGVTPVVEGLKSLAATKGFNLQEADLNALNGLTETQVANYLTNGANKSTDLNHYFSWFPPMVDAHLAARGLKTPPAAAPIK